MRKLYFLLAFLSLSFLSQSQTTVFSENFDVSQGATYSTGGLIGSSSIWNVISAPDFGARINGGYLGLTNDATAATNANGFAYGHVNFSSFSSPFNPILSLNPGLLTWTFNMRQIRSDPGGFVPFGSYGVGYILAANSSFTGYAVLLGQSGVTDPVRLVRFNANVALSSDIIISNTAGLADFGNEYLSIKVTYDPATNNWELFVRNDGASGFADPSIGVLTSQGVASDNTYTGVTMANMGGFWTGSTSVTPTDQTAYFDNVNVSVEYTLTNTITTGAVSTVPYNLANCSSTANGNVAFTSTDVFGGSNVFTAQLSDATGSFVSPVTVGSIALSGNSPAGNINITIPAGTPSGGGYKIRVVSSNPIVTGTESAAFSIIQNGVGCTSSPTDHFRSRTNGFWGDPTTWESSINNIDWINSTIVPTSDANTITIRSGHVVALIADASADQLIIQGGGILLHSGGVFTINDGGSDDVSIENGGALTLASAGNNPVFNGNAVCNVLTGGILRISASGLTGTGDAIHRTNVIFQHSSILEYTSTTEFSTSDITYFPHVNTATIPIFRLTSIIPTNPGAITTTRWNGIFECNGSVTFASSGSKIFRNGIRGAGTISALSGTGKFVIDGESAELGGSVVLDFAFSQGLEVGTPTDVTLTATKTINGNLRILGASYISLGNFDLTVTGVFLDPLQTGWVRTNGTGKLIMPSIGSGSFGKLMLVGLTSCNPVYINSIVQTTYTARIVEPITPPIYNENGAVLRTWYMSCDEVSPNNNFSFIYTYPSDVGPSYQNLGPVQAGINVNGVWNLVQSGLTPTTPLSTLISGTDLYMVSPSASFTHFNGPGNEFPIVIANNGAILSLDCIIFAQSQKLNGKGIISWEVSNCDEVNAFIVERSVNGGPYQSIGSITPGSELRYQFIDDSPQRGLNSYRIRVNGITGDHKYSNVVMVFNEDRGILFTVAPNPVKETARISIHSARATRATMKLVNASGALVRQWTTELRNGTHYEELSMSGLPSGSYLLHLESENGIYSQMILKQ